VLAGLCVGVTAMAETGSVILGWGLKPAYIGVLFGLYSLTIVVIGGLVAVRHPDNPAGWILAVFGVQNAVLADLVAAYGLQAASQGWAGGPLAQWIGFGTWSPGALMWVLALLFIPTGGCRDRGGGLWPGPAASGTCCISPDGCSTPPTALPSCRGATHMQWPVRPTACWWRPAAAC
jgi:hypothetical protein